MNKNQQDQAALKFQKDWNGSGYEKGESQKFWIDLLTHLYGVTDIKGFIEFEKQVKLSHTSFIDGYIPSTKVMIEQKGSHTHGQCGRVQIHTLMHIGGMGQAGRHHNAHD